MKNGSIKLQYHSMHKRPMQGCLPFFLFMSGLAVWGMFRLVEVDLPEPLKPKGAGRVLYRDDSVTRFYVAQHSALPLRLPEQTDPAVQSPLPEQALSEDRVVELEMAPAVFPFANDLNSMVFDSETLLALPPLPEEETEENEEKEVQP